DHPDQFPLFTVIEHAATSQLVATGVVAPDVARTVPVISIATGRVVEIKARLGDTVKKGQLLMRVQSADDVENKAQVDVDTAAEHLRVLGSPLDHPSGIVDVYAPVSGVITDQQV